MTHPRCTTLLAVALGLAGACALAAEDPINALLAKHPLPAQSRAEAQALTQALVQAGPAGVEALVGKLQVPGKDDDSAARLALHALVLHVTRPDAQAERKWLTKALAAQLDKDLPAPVKAFVIQQFRFVGDAQAVDALAKRLTDDALCEDAAQALLSIRAGAAAAFRQALPQAKGPCRRTIIQALGVLGDRGAATAARQDLASKDRQARVVAMAALASMGDPAAVDPLLKATGSADAYERRRATEACLALARRLAEAKQTQVAQRIYEHLWKQGGRHVQCAALEGLAAAVGVGAKAMLLDGLKSDDDQLAAAAVRAAASVPGAAATKQWAQALAGAEPGLRYRILQVLAAREDKAGLPASLHAMKDKDASVRAAAIAAVGAIGKADAVGPLVAALGSESQADQQAARGALVRIPGHTATAAMAKLTRTIPPASRCALLDVLAKRGAVGHLPVIIQAAKDKDESVRVAALGALSRLVDESTLPDLLDLLLAAKTPRVQKAAEDAAANACGRVWNKGLAADHILARLPKAGLAARCALLRVTRRTGSSKALSPLREALKDANKNVRDAAVRAMAEWPNAAVVTDLFGIAKTSPDTVHRVLALRGYVRVVGLRSKRPAKETLRMYQQAMDIAQRPDEKKRVLAGTAKVRDPGAITLAQACLADPALRAEAGAAMVQAAKGLGDSHPAEARAALRTVLQHKPELAAAKTAAEVLKELSKYAGYLTTWQIAAPYTVAGKSGTQVFDVAFPPEQPKAEGVKWQPLKVDKDVKKRWRLQMGKGNHRAGYLRTYVWSPKPQQACLQLGSDDGIKVWLNGKVIHSLNVPRSLKADEDKLDLSLPAGWNCLLVKVVNGGGGWEACVRLSAAEGPELEGIRVGIEPKD